MITLSDFEGVDKNYDKVKLVTSIKEHISKLTSGFDLKIVQELCKGRLQITELDGFRESLINHIAETAINLISGNEFFEVVANTKKYTEKNDIPMETVIKKLLNNTKIGLMLLVEGGSSFIHVVEGEIESTSGKVCGILGIENFENKEALTQHINENSEYEVIDII